MARWNFALTIDRTSSRPLVRQIADALSAELRRGRFASLSENELRNAVSRLALAVEETLSRATRSRAQRGA